MKDQKTKSSRKVIVPLLGIALSVLTAFLVALAASQHSIVVAEYPLIFICAALAFGIQWIAFIPAYIFQTERYYDLIGSVSFISVTSMALILGTSSITEGLDARSLLIAVLVLVWACRLGSFLFLRILSAGKDARFDAIKVNFLRFLMTWTLQGLWVFLTMACALAAMTTAQPQTIGVIAVIGAVIWLAGFGIEVVADAQKSRFNRDPANAGKFIESGLWAWSRHPNYFGEIVLWTGIAIIAIPVLTGWQWVTLISPVFVFVLLTRISGIPMLERRADKKWGGEQAYTIYKAKTPVLLPSPPN